MKAFCLLAVAGLVNSSPVPQFQGIKDIFSSLSGSDRAGETNGNHEQVPYKTINKTVTDGLSFEVREYPSVKWVCTEMTYPRDEDAEKGPSAEKDEAGIIAMMSKMTNGKDWQKKPQSKMFMKLFRYISGVNKERVEVEMTVPVLSELTPQEGNMMHKQMCFYLDSAAQASPPTPDTDDVVIEENKPFTVAVYEFGGYAMSDSTWEAEAAQFAARLGDRMKSLETASYYTASYDSPMKFWNRKNEIMYKLKI